jgi:hypothetical protein
LITIVGDINKSGITELLKETLFNTKRNKLFDAIFSNFSFHYFINDDKSCVALVREIYNWLRTDGYIVITGADGLRIMEHFNKLKTKEGKAIELKNNTGKVLFSITKKFPENELKKFGQKIDVFISSIGKSHEEMLLNFDAIGAVFERLSFRLIENVPFMNLYPAFINKRKGTKCELSNAERIFSGYNRIVVYQKITRPPTGKKFGNKL